MNTEGVDCAVAFPGLNALQFYQYAEYRRSFFGLKPFDQRNTRRRKLTPRSMPKSRNPAGLWLLPSLPPILGWVGSGYWLYIQDRAGLDGAL